MNAYEVLKREEVCYVREFCGSYRRVITSLVANGLTRGMTLQEMVRLSLRAANAYARSHTDNAVQRAHIHKRMDPVTWAVLEVFGDVLG